MFASFTAVTLTQSPQVAAHGRAVVTEDALPSSSCDTHCSSRCSSVLLATAHRVEVRHCVPSSSAAVVKVLDVLDVNIAQVILTLIELLLNLPILLILLLLIDKILINKLHR